MDLLQKVQARIAALCAPSPAAGPCLHQRLLDTHGQVWISLLWGHCSFILGPGAHKVLFVPSKSLFPQSCVSSGGSIVGLMATSSNRPYATPRSTAPKAPIPTAVHCWPVPLQETPKQTNKITVREKELARKILVLASTSLNSSQTKSLRIFISPVTTHIT